VSRELPADEQPRASILIAAFNPATFGRCVRSLAEHLSGAPSCEVIATLNGPTDALLESAGDIEGLRTIDTPVNLGLAAGANLARRGARGELMVLVQDDAEIEPGWLETLVATADEHPDAGAVGGLVAWPEGDRVQTAGLVLWADCSHSEVGAGTDVAEWDEREPFAADYCSSSSLLVRADTWDEIGGLDDTFFPAGHVDADLAMRIRRSGRALLVEPRARSRHRRGASSSTRFKRFIAVRNGLLFRERWGEELARTQEPRGEAGPAEIERALARVADQRKELAEARGAAGASSPAPPDAPPKRPDPPDPLVFAARHIELHREHEADLEPALDHLETENPELWRRVNELIAVVEARDAQLAEITGGGWWRLRERLLPLLGAARALGRRLRRTP
jgi:GT2 family glycosyltransferase